MPTIPFFLLSLAFFTVSTSSLAQRQSQTIEIDQHQLNVTRWSAPDLPATADSVLLISGPTDNWNSDSAWFARLAPKLIRQFNVVSVDRAGQVVQNANAPLGYAQFGRDLAKLLPKLQLGKIHVIAFASANLAIHQFFAEPNHPEIASLVLIDPDVLLDYSINRYKKDAQHFKDNLAEYLAYISAGKYDTRANEKNTLELAHLKSLNGGDPDTDWQYVDEIFNSRLTQTSLHNTFKEIAIYDQDLDLAKHHPLPESLPVTVIDTNFEHPFIAKADDAKERDGLIRWQAEAKNYYQALADHSVKGRYVALPTEEHLLPFADPQLLVELIANAKAH